MNFGENLKRLRRERGVTLEELAGTLSVAPQTISKWERAESYPDFPLLPPLASYFGASLDELVGMEEFLGAELQKIIVKFETDMTHTLTNLDELINAVRRYPTNEHLLHLAAMTLPNYAISGFKWGQIDGIPEDRNRAVEVRDLAVTCAERLLKTTNNLEYIANAYGWLITLYCEWEQFEKAEEIAERFPTQSLAMSYDRNLKLAGIKSLRGDADGALAHRCEAMLETAYGLERNVRDLAGAYNAAGKVDDALAVAKYLEGFMRLTLPGEPLEKLFDTAPAYASLALYSAKCGDFDGALAYLEKFVDAAIAEQEKDRNEFDPPEYKTPLFKHRIMPEHGLYFGELGGALDDLRRVLGSDCLEPLRSDPRFIALSERAEREGKPSGLFY
jgi:transcriptional regulator with XRE-family HTH domain